MKINKQLSILFLSKMKWILHSSLHRIHSANVLWFARHCAMFRNNISELGSPNEAEFVDLLYDYCWKNVLFLLIGGCSSLSSAMLSLYHYYYFIIENGFSHTVHYNHSFPYLYLLQPAPHLPLCQIHFTLGKRKPPETTTKRNTIRYSKTLQSSHSY